MESSSYAVRHRIAVVGANELRLSRHGSHHHQRAEAGCTTCGAAHTAALTSKFSNYHSLTYKARESIHGD